MQGEYTEQWAELRRLRRRLITTLAAGAAIFVLVPISRSVPGRWANVLGLGVFLAWAVVVIRLFSLYVKYRYWLCPRCGKPFHMRVSKFGRWENVFARRCIHCGLIVRYSAAVFLPVRSSFRCFTTRSAVLVSSPEVLFLGGS